ncbi:MAG: hypothetical protein AAFO99_02790 [Bacteroidota bacterium]
MRSYIPLALIPLVFWFFCCSTDGIDEETIQTTDEASKSNGLAKVTNVTTTGTANDYTFSVSIESPDTGCNQYANWWEVIDLEGNLIYRRIMAHSHVDEQPFTRSGGIISISGNQEVYIRAHMNTNGYGTSVFKGSVENGFSADVLDANFAKELQNQEPLPTSCAF